MFKQIVIYTYIVINLFQFCNIRKKNFCIAQTFGHLTIERNLKKLLFLNILNLIQKNHFCLSFSC